MTHEIDKIAVQRFHLLDDELPSEITAAFEEYESKNHEFGLGWLRNLAANALPIGEHAYIYVASVSPTEFAAFPIRLDVKAHTAHALSNYYSSLYSPVVQSRDPQPLFTALFRHIAQSEGLVSITLSPMDTESVMFGDLQSALANARLKGVHTWCCFVNWIHTPLDADYPTYLASRPSRLRNTIARKTRKFLQGNRGTLKIVANDHELSDTVEQFQSVYRKSWKREEPHPTFIPRLLELAARQGWLRLGIASYDDKPIAAQIWLVANGTASIFKLAYNEDYKSLSPGTILTAHLMAHVIEVDAVTTIDYLTGDDAYKKDWMSQKCERRGIAAYNVATFRGLTAFTVHKLKILVKMLRH